MMPAEKPVQIRGVKRAVRYVKFRAPFPLEAAGGHVSYLEAGVRISMVDGRPVVPDEQVLPPVMYWDSEAAGLVLGEQCVPFSGGDIRYYKLA